MVEWAGWLGLTCMQTIFLEKTDIKMHKMYYHNKAVKDNERISDIIGNLRSQDNLRRTGTTYTVIHDLSKNHILTLNGTI